MKKILLIIGILLIASIAEAKIYVCLDKSTGEVKGTVDIDEKMIGDWAKQCVMIEADESYRGKQGFEIKFEGKKLRNATKNEIEDYNKEQAGKVKDIKKAKALEDLGLTDSDLEKIKSLKDEKPIIN